MGHDARVFSDEVRSIVRAIPAGQTMSYAAVARLAGSPNGARAVARILANNDDPSVPCHRVIMSDGTLGSYNRGGEQAKRRRLLTEGAILERSQPKKRGHIMNP